MAANNKFELMKWGDEAYEEGLRTPQNNPTEPASTNAPKRPTETKSKRDDPATAAVAKKLDFKENTTDQTNLYNVLKYESDSE